MPRFREEASRLDDLLSRVTILRTITRTLRPYVNWLRSVALGESSRDLSLQKMLRNGCATGVAPVMVLVRVD